MKHFDQFSCDSVPLRNAVLGLRFINNLNLDLQIKCYFHKKIIRASCIVQLNTNKFWYKKIWEIPWNDQKKNRKRLSKFGNKEKLSLENKTLFKLRKGKKLTLLWLLQYLFFCSHLLCWLLQTNFTIRNNEYFISFFTILLFIFLTRRKVRKNEKFKTKKLTYAMFELVHFLLFHVTWI